MSDKKTPLSWIRPSVRALTAYHLERRDGPVKLDQNENNLGVPEAMRDAFLEALTRTPLHRYPSPSQAEILGTVGAVYLSVGEFGKAIEFLTRASVGQRLVFGPDHPKTLITLHNLAAAYREDGNLPDTRSR